MSSGYIKVAWEYNRTVQCERLYYCNSCDFVHVVECESREERKWEEGTTPECHVSSWGSWHGNIYRAFGADERRALSDDELIPHNLGGLRCARCGGEIKERWRKIIENTGEAL